MKFLIFFASAFATVLAKDLHSRFIEDPVLENEGRITRGEDAKPDDFRYQAGIALNILSTGIWCGGSLLNQNWVLTAASCTNAASSGKVYLGSLQFMDGEVVHNITKSDIFTHKAWQAAFLAHNIALIRIPTTAESVNIGYVRIPSNNDNKYIGDSAVVSGWGRPSDEGTGLSNHLQYAVLKVSPGNVCFERYGLAYDDSLSMCVATPNKVSTCKGDSGDPMILEGKNIQIGVYSFVGDNGCTNKAPLLFTRVSAYLFWIKKNAKGIGE